MRISDSCQGYVQEYRLTVIHSAIWAENECFGRFKVIWDNVPWPNIKKPIAPTQPYIVVHNAKLETKAKVSSRSKWKHNDWITMQILTDKTSLLFTKLLMPC